MKSKKANTNKQEDDIDSLIKSTGPAEDKKVKEDFIEKSIRWFAVCNTGLAIVAAYFSTIVAVCLLAVLLFGYLVISSDYGKKKLKKLQVMWEFRPYMKASKSLNHSTTLVAKYIFGLPVKQEESEIDSFNEIKDHFGPMWPFMLKVKDTREKKITVSEKPVRCMSSYNYLDLARDESVQKAAIDAANRYSSGNHGPRMLCGNLQILEDLEEKISKFLRKEASLVFSSGYLACMSTIAGIARKGDLLLMDKLCHASLVAGSKLSAATVVRFKHNDFADAEKQIKKHKFKKLIMVIEGIYSMDGDIGDLPTARKLCDKYKGLLILDEAHSLGTIGKTGHGTEEHFGYTCQADIICGSFTKAISSVGGYLSCSRKMREYYTFYAPGAVFSAPLSAYHAGAAMRAFDIIEEKPEMIQRLQENSEYLRAKLRANKFNIGNSVTCVFPVIYRDIAQLIEMHSYLLQKGFFAAAVMAPACPLDEPRYRVCVTAGDDKKFLDEVVDALVEAREKFPESKKITNLIEVMK